MNTPIPAALLPADMTPLRSLPGSAAYGLTERGRYLYLGQTIVAGRPALQVSWVGSFTDDARSCPLNMSWAAFRACFVW